MTALPRSEHGESFAVGEGSKAPALAVDNLSKTFSGGRALENVSFALEPGKVHALIGGNGSGKSTLVKCLAGIQPADPGGVVIVGAEQVAGDHISPTWSRAHGLRFVHQDPGMWPTLTVQENFALGNGYPTRGGQIRWGALAKRTESLLERFNIAAKPDQLLASLRPADRAMIAIARAAQDRYDDEAGDVSALILDEPTASLPEEEVELLLQAIRRYVQDGLAIVFVNHRLEEVLAISDTVTVLRDGTLVTSRTAEGLGEKDLVQYIVGEALVELELEREKRVSDPGNVVAELDRVTAGPLRDVSLNVAAGEIVGIAGRLGSGRTEVLQVLFGALKAESGRVVLGGREERFNTPSEAMARGVALVPEDRGDTVFSSMNVRENFSAPSMKRYSRVFVDRRREKEEANASLKAFGVKSAGWEVPISLLSGGNQQKVVLARWLHRQPRLLLLDEPTQGVDVGARAEAYAIIHEAAERGMAVIVVSSDLEELAELSNRVFVLTAGRITAELTGRQVTRHNLNEQVLLEKAYES